MYVEQSIQFPSQPPVFFFPFYIIYLRKRKHFNT
nr:MAG TPA: hypothetical protein [Caudoviricetes sp.]